MNILSLGTSATVNVKGLSSSTSSTSQGRAPYELRIGAFMKRELEVVSFEGHEKLNAPYVYDVVFASSVPVAALQAAVFGFPACLSIQAPQHEPRVIQGLAVGFEAVGAAEGELATKTRRYMVRIVPRLWLLNHSRKYRVFQGQSAIQIACAVLGEAGITPDIRLQRDEYPPIPFMYQRGETDLEFLHHVLAVAGVFYYFQHASGLLDQLVPGAGEVGALAGGLGGMAGAAGSLGSDFNFGAAGGSLSAGLDSGLDGSVSSALGGAAGAVGGAASAVGAVTTLVLCDRAKHTNALQASSLSLGTLAGATSDLAGAMGSMGGALGSIAGAVGVGANVIEGASADTLPYDGNGQAASATERVFSFRARTEVRPKRVTLRDWNMREAKNARTTEDSSVATLDADVGISAATDLFGNGSLSVNAAANLALDALAVATSDVSVMEYQRDPALLAARDHFAEHALAQLRSDRVTARGESDCRRLAPGYRFVLAGHPIAPVNIEYVVTGVRTAGYAPDHLPADCSHSYRSSFDCVPASIDPRPQKPAPKPPFGPEPALVVGPVYGDVHCDSIGRIQVQFRWAEPSLSSSSATSGVCWAHWLERWGGDGYGTQTLPRVGTEVLVDFHMGGEPIAVGQIHSRASAPAFSLPSEATKVGIRTRTVPTGGESEISIDDNPFSEKILVRTSGDFHTQVACNTKTELSGEYDLTVADDRRESTGGDATLAFAQDVTVDVKGSLREEVAEDRAEIVLGSLDEYVEGDVSRVVGGRVDAVTQGPHSHVFEADSVERHIGHHAVVVAAQGAAGAASAVLHVEGAARAYAKNLIEVASPEGFTFSCGDSLITIRKDSVTIASPTITLVGKTVQVTASDTAAVAAKTATVAGSDSVTVSGANKATLAGQSATVVLDANATVQGSAVKLGSGGSGSSSSQQNKTTKISTLRLSDPDGKPFANQRIVLRKGGDGGEERVVVLDANGTTTLEGDDPVDVLFPDNPGGGSS